MEDVRYRYGFEVSTERVVREYLLQSKRTKEYPLFLRIEDDFQIDKKRFPEGVGKDDWTRKNALFLSLVAQLNGKLAQKIIDWFDKIVFVHHVCDCEEEGITEELWNKPEYEELIVKLMKAIDVDIEDLELVKFEETKMLKTGKRIESPDETYEIRTFHKLYNEKNEEVGLEDFSLYEDESDGTNRYFNLIGYFIKALSQGGVVVIDEIDSRLHTLIAESIINQFNSIENNRAQLIFTTHDTNLMGRDLMRRDQIYFVEKDQYGASKLYSLAEFKARKDHNYEKNYLEGRYGAVPFVVNAFEDVLKTYGDGEKKA